jgi:hypothetical protein
MIQAKLLEFLKKYWLYIVIGLAALIIGFFLGRGNTKTITKTVYIKGKEIHDSVPKPYPVTVYIPSDPILPTKPETIRIAGKPEYHVLKVDTAKIIANYIVKRSYKINAFDNKNGKLVIKPVVQYNELQSIPYDFTPMTQITTVTKERLITPFVGASWNSFGFVGAGGGVYYKNIGLGAKYITDFTKTGFEINGYVKF